MLNSVSINAESTTATTSPDDDPSQRSVRISDRELIERFLKEKTEDVFVELISRFGAMVFAVAMRCLRDRHAAEDVFQATFFVLARDARKIRSRDSLASWLHGTALRMSKRALARKHNEIALGQAIVVGVDDSLLDDIAEQFEQQLLDEELQRLPTIYRAPLVLHFLEGKSCEETAHALGITVGAVRGRLQRGKRELKFRLMKRGVEYTSIMGTVVLWQSMAEAAVGPPLITAAAHGGIAASQGTSFGSGCSPEAVHLAAQETTMFTATKLFVTSAVLATSLTTGWFAHAAVSTSSDASEANKPILPITDTENLDDKQQSVDVAEEIRLLKEPSTLAFAEAEESDSPGKPQLVLKYGDGQADGKKSIAGTGEMIRFTLPDKSQKLQSLRIHCARYGTPKPPDEDAEITIVSEDGSDIIHTEFVPYSTFKRGESRWTTVRLEEVVEVPETFWVILQFNAERTKGVSVSFDKSTDGKNSKTGLPGGEAVDANIEGDWMVQAILTKPE